MVTREIAFSEAQCAADRTNETQYVWEYRSLGGQIGWCFAPVPDSGFSYTRVPPRSIRPIDQDQTTSRRVVY